MVSQRYLSALSRSCSAGFFASRTCGTGQASENAYGGSNAPGNRTAKLEKDAAYRVAIAHRPSNYAVFFYLQPKAFSERLAALRAAVRSSPAPGESTMLQKMRCIAGSMRFDDGKIHDVLFLGMPKLERSATLTRSSLSLGTKETFFYLAMLRKVGEDIRTPNPGAAIAPDND